MGCKAKRKSSRQKQKQKQKQNMQMFRHGYKIGMNECFRLVDHLVRIKFKVSHNATPIMMMKPSQTKCTITISKWTRR